MHALCNPKDFERVKELVRNNLKLMLTVDGVGHDIYVPEGWVCLMAHPGSSFWNPVQSILISDLIDWSCPAYQSPS